MLKELVPSIEQNARKSYGREAGGFSRGMNTVPFTGQGLQVAYNCQFKNGQIHAQSGNSEFIEEAGTGRIESMYPYQKPDGSYQMLVFFEDPANAGQYLMRAYEEDGTKIIPGGTLGDVVFPNNSIYSTQITLHAYVSVDDTFTNGNLYQWDGIEFVKVSAVPDNPKFLGREGRRLVIGAEGLVTASRADQNPVTAFLGGTNADIAADYRVNKPGIPTAFKETGAGSIIAFPNGLELHNITETEDGLGVFNETRSRNFNFTGEGVDSPRKITVDNVFVDLITPSGQHQVNPLTGEYVNLINDNAGKIRDYFKRFNQENAIIIYSPKDEMIVTALSDDDSGTNNILLCFHLSTGAFYVREGSFHSLAVMNRQLYAGSSVDGKIFKIFDDSTYQDGYGNDRKIKATNEWDALTGFNTLKVPLDIFLNVKGASDKTFELNIYVDGYTDIAFSQTFSISDLSDTGSVTTAMGAYGMGSALTDEVSGSDKVTKSFFNQPFRTWCWEIVTDTQEDFVVRDVQLEFIDLYEVPESTDYPNNLFSIN